MTKTEKEKEKEKKINERVRLLEETITLDIPYMLLLVTHGNLCLALKHPKNTGISRTITVDFVKTLGDILEEAKVITPARRREAEKEVTEFQ